VQIPVLVGALDRHAFDRTYLCLFGSETFVAVVWLTGGILV